MSCGGAYGNLLPLRPNHFSNDYACREQMLMMVRAFLCCLGSHFAGQEYTYVGSPFLNMELFEFCMSVPVEKRIGHALYKKWILSKHPEAAAYKWEKINAKITAHQETKLDFQLKRVKRVLKDPRRLVWHFTHFVPPTLSGMNPYDYWWQTNTRLRNYFDTYFEQNIDVLDAAHHGTIREQVTKLYREGRTLEKCNALTALSAVKLLGLK